MMNLKCDDALFEKGVIIENFDVQKLLEKNPNVKMNQDEYPMH